MPGGDRDSRRLIIEAARAEFAEFGYAGARTSRIAERAGVNKQLIHYYFASKAGLYDEVMRAASTQLETVAAPDHDRLAPHTPDRLRQQLRSVFDTLARNPGLASLIVRAASERQRETPAAERALYELVTHLAHAISKGQGLGYFRDDVDPKGAARQAVVLLLGYLTLESALAEGPAESRRAAWIDGVCDLLVRSLTW
ncbi:MAG: TetR family transcriptional regulator [Gemmatimonadales bacterium]|nr:TetR family transcriptional regulator [Gemmatimonadales bacterium]NIN10382.1 TetR family transcriptional regulator [Gemmatimonadales bacterium]NIN49174.1 TetR family transcriptional regulator [Gemmatimonadales bacterium]NIP06638.1 TetR family transcriptional regulator [Gemmatimonadales bacterium]NIQ99968.1 TetR family transcriptional regulator [Gemmatimonadales bacterium]